MEIRRDDKADNNLGILPVAWIERHPWFDNLDLGFQVNLALEFGQKRPPSALARPRPPARVAMAAVLQISRSLYVTGTWHRSFSGWRRTNASTHC